jgi:F-type H+-transporting ATPase subunit delta
VIRNPAAKRYAEAVLQLAKEQGRLEEWAQYLDVIAQAMGQPEVARALDDARLPLEVRLRVVDEAMAGLDPLARNLAKLLVLKGRASLAPEIARAYREMVDRERGIVHALVKTAIPLEEGEREELRGRLEAALGRPVVLEAQVDESIISGLVLQIGDRVIDASTRAQLQALRRHLAEAQT